MPTYEYRCGFCDEITEAEYRIGTARRLMNCQYCGGRASLVIGAGVQIAPSALETKGGEVRASNAREKRWQRDMPAYYRMRMRGLQPKGIDGAALVEDRVDDQMDIERGHLYDSEVTKQRVIAAEEEAKEIVQADA